MFKADKNNTKKAVKKKYLTALFLSCMIAKCDDGRGADRMEKIVEHGLLYDFYGELLTAHQRQIYEDAVYHDMSLTEIADIQGISRQGVHDLIRRCDKILEQYEERLGLVKRFALIKEKVLHIDALAKELLEQGECDTLEKEPSEQSANGAASEQGKLEVQTAEQEMQEARQVVREAVGVKAMAKHLAAIRTLSGEIIEEL